MKKTFLLLLNLLVSSYSFAQIPSTLGWYDIPNSKIRPVCSTDPTVQGIDGCPGVTIAWNSGVMDTLRNRLIVWGGGHGDYFGNEIYAVNLSTLTTTRITNPGLPVAPSGQNPEAIAGGTQPNSRHTYDGISYMANIDKMFVYGGSLAQLGFASRGTWLFNFATNLWEDRTNATGTIPNGDYGIVSAYDPNTGLVFLHDNYNLFSYNASTNAYTRLTNNASAAIDYHCAAAIDPVLKRFVIVGGNLTWSWYDIAPGSSYVIQTLPQTGAGSLVGAGYPGFDWDSITGHLVGWPGGNSVYAYNWTTSSWTTQTFTGGPAALSNGTMGRFSFSPATGVFVVYGSVDADAFVLRTEFPTSFQVTSTNTGTLPFMVGLVFKKGDFPSNAVLDITDQQVIIKRRWNDGSVKHAIASGQVALTANTPKTVNVLTSSASVPAGLTSANITAAAPSASVQLGAIGTVNLSSLLAAPFRTWITGPEMVECHYRSNVGSDTSLNVWFHVRLYKAGRIWVRAIVENGYVGVSVGKSYIPTIIIGGTTVYNNGGATLNHYANTRYSSEGWIGGNPAVTPKHVTQYLIDTKLVPNYWKRNPSNLNGLLQVYTPMSNGSLEATMGNAGYQPGIGLLPQWDALYITSTDARAFRSCLANSSHLNSYGIVWRNSSTQLVVKPSDNPTPLNAYGWVAGPLTWEMNHYPSEGYTAYLVSGDYWHYETMLFNTAMSLMLLNGVGGRGNGVSCLLTGETRGTAWNLRTLSQYDGIFPAGDPIGTEYQTLLANNMTFWQTVKNSLTAPGLGDVYEYGFPYGDGTIAPWQQHFFDQSVGMGSDLEPLANMTVYNDVRTFLDKWPVGILGDATGFFFNYASAYNAKISDSAGGGDPLTFYPTWLQVWNASKANGTIPPSPVFDNILKGSSGSDPGIATQGYWGNLMPAIAYAVDHGAAGASAAWARLIGATNFYGAPGSATVEGSGFDDTPQWGIVPRSTVQSSIPTAPTNVRVIGN
jgi:hypothetical protein